LHFPILNRDLFETADFNFAPPLILRFPIQRKVASRGNVPLGAEVYFEIKWIGFALKKIGWLLGGIEQLLLGSMIFCNCRTNTYKKNCSGEHNLFHDCSK